VPLGAGAAELPAELELPLDAAGVVVDVVAALDELPVNKAAPIAPPVRVEPTIATATAAFRNGLMLALFLAFLTAFGPERFGLESNPAAETSGQAWL
jgi:hypothetical protein